MAAFKPHLEHFNCHVWSTLPTAKHYSPDQPRCRRRRRTVAEVQFLRRRQETYSVYDKPSSELVAVADRKEQVLGRQVVRIDCAANTAVIVGALKSLGISNSEFPWIPTVEKIVEILKHLDGGDDDDDDEIITVDFVSTKIYRCFEEVADSC